MARKARSGPRRWDAAAFDKFIDDGRDGERAREVPMKERLFVNRKIAAACDASTETLRKWRQEDSNELPDVDEYEALRFYFSVPDGTWLKS